MSQAPMSQSPLSQESKSQRSAQAVILAAGEGTRMRSTLPKVLHRVAGRTMLAHVIDAAQGAGVNRIAVVVGPGADSVRHGVVSIAPDSDIFEQVERKGTAHAVLAARPALVTPADDVVILFGDTPLITADIIIRVRAALADGADVAVAGFRTNQPTGYGRLIEQDGALVAIREEKDASDAERAIRFCNAGLMGLSGARALAILDQIGANNAQREFYLTDAVSIAAANQWRAVAVEADATHAMGVNDRSQLAAAEAAMQARLRSAALAAGVTMTAPDTVFLCADTRLGRDVIIEPHVVFGPGVVVEEGAVIHAFSHLEGARVAAGASIGPFARLRPGAMIGERARIGNFVEIKNVSFGADAKANHLAYIGDATVGPNANIGAGTITCNYDGFDKFRTVIGEGAFIGSNSALVAPVTIGAGAYVGSGSVVTDDVAPDALALARGRQIAKSGWAAAFRARKADVGTPR